MEWQRLTFVVVFALAAGSWILFLWGFWHVVRCVESIEANVRRIAEREKE